MKNHFTAIIFAVAIITAAFIFGNAVVNRNQKDGTIAVTGLGKTDFTSDLIVWEAKFSQSNLSLKDGYSKLKQDRITILEYLKANGLPDSVIVFSAVETKKNTKPNYSENGKYLGETFIGYTLMQTVHVDSKAVELVETISREVTDLLNKGIQLYSIAPRYYYTKLEDLKIEMIAQATENANLRAKRIAENSGAKLNDLVSANMGIFQITGQNSNENYSWGGVYNTSSKEKTASITMKLIYKVD
ncbi:SIMPL domain-containing protein [Tamlana fucoidanivorans]|uniref:SIMPL domain-containing protein n=1 Tax=Allotamlana fucoidanivorans TaxID=2583814 RepID=A0A5C4SKM1_9FLAO|nr:SIMPL domain-containing protein [Tamlana fucoidanivorans]TNJ44538.1 SIMPL domain-containing protein [Tamlana fucoidanivorans]